MTDWSQWEAEQAAQQAQIEELRKRNLAAQGQVSETPFFGGSAYDANAASAGTGRGALSVRGDEVGYYGNGQWNSLGAAPAVGSPQWLSMVQQASYEGDQQANMMARNAGVQAPTPSYTFSQPPSWAQQPQQPAPQQSMLPQGGGQTTSPFRPTMYGGGLLGGSNAGMGGTSTGQGGSRVGTGSLGFQPFGMNSFFQNYWGRK